MTRYIMPIVIIGIAITFFFMVTNPIYVKISASKNVGSTYNEALDTSKSLQKERDQLTSQSNGIDPNNLAKLQTFLPDNVNNIRLILEIEQLASPYGMVLNNVKYNATPTGSKTATADTATVVQGGNTASKESKDYGTFDLEFSTSGTYDNFMNFTKDLESNLRIIDISSVTFSSSSTVGSGSKANSAEVYNYDFKIKTYWLKS